MPVAEQRGLGYTAGTPGRQDVPDDVATDLCRWGVDMEIAAFGELQGPDHA